MKERSRFRCKRKKNPICLGKATKLTNLREKQLRSIVKSCKIIKNGATNS